MKRYARKCSKCGKLMNSGFVVGGGDEYYCSEKCLYKEITPEEWDELYEECGDQNYWTEWEDEQDFGFYEDGSEVEEV